MLWNKEQIKSLTPIQVRIVLSLSWKVLGVRNNFILNNLEPDQMIFVISNKINHLQEEQKQIIREKINAYDSKVQKQLETVNSLEVQELTLEIIQKLTSTELSFLLLGYCDAAQSSTIDNSLKFISENLSNEQILGLDLKVFSLLEPYLKDRTAQLTEGIENELSQCKRLLVSLTPVQIFLLSPYIVLYVKSVEKSFFSREQKYAIKRQEEKFKKVVMSDPTFCGYIEEPGSVDMRNLSVDLVSVLYDYAKGIFDEFCCIFTKEHMQAFRSDQLETFDWNKDKVKDHQILYLKVSQVEGITDETVLSTLRDRVGVANVQELTIENIQGLQPIQICLLTAKQILEMSTKQIQAMSETQIKCFTPQALVELIQSLTPNQIKAIEPSQIQAFKGEQIQSFKPEVIAALIHLLTPDQICVLNESQVKIIESKDLRNLSSDRVYALKKNKKIQNVSLKARFATEWGVRLNLETEERKAEKQKNKLKQK